jgi:hypothetical protein
MSVQSEPRVEKPICTHSKSMAFLISRVRGKSPNNQGLGLITLLLGAEAVRIMLWHQGIEQDEAEATA